MYGQLEMAADKKNLLFGVGKWQGNLSGADDELEGQVKPWKVMVIDDDDEVHQVTIMVLSDYSFAGRPIQIIQGYSGGSCRNLMKKHPDTAVLLLDVVMETESSGLDTVQYIREQLNNKTVQIVLRTGQPGQAPEQKILQQYDINGYLEKSDLTAQRLFSCMTTSLRAYQNLVGRTEDDRS